VNARLKMMDEFDGLQQVLSLANPPIELLARRTRRRARAHRERRAGELCRNHPLTSRRSSRRWPMNNVDACVREAERAIRDLGAKGVQIFTNVLGRPLSAPEFRPLFQTMASRPAGVDPSIRGPQFSTTLREILGKRDLVHFRLPYETTACVTRLIFSGIYDELPGLKIISTTWADGALLRGQDRPRLRPDLPRQRPTKIRWRGRRALKKRPAEYYRMLYADTSLNGSAPRRAAATRFSALRIASSPPTRLSTPSRGAC